MCFLSVAQKKMVPNVFFVCCTENTFQFQMCFLCSAQKTHLEPFFSLHCKENTFGKKKKTRTISVIFKKYEKFFFFSRTFSGFFLAGHEKKRKKNHISKKSQKSQKYQKNLKNHISKSHFKIIFIFSIGCNKTRKIGIFTEKIIIVLGFDGYFFHI